ncbi:MAG: SBBP repeat-containing protein [Saprospiraceae bacterium]|nr:SBBP repeat-containing protein [Saprospiraceae bacterium]
MKKFNITLLFLILSQLTIAQNYGLEWAIQMGGIGINDDNWGYSITTDANGNVYSTGFFTGTVDFDPGAGTANLTSVGNRDIFIQKLNSTGNLLWAKQIGGTSYDYGISIKTDASGNVYTTGSFSGTVDFDPGIGTVNLTSVGNADIFIQKLDPAGNLLWVKQMGGIYDDEGYSITTDAAGNLYTTGIFRGTVDFDPGVGTTNLISAGLDDVFILKLDTAGNLLWVKQMGGSSTDQVYSITTDAAGNIYTTGFFSGTADFDPGIGITNLTSAGIDDIFIQKLNSAGNLLWAKQMGGTSYDFGMSITTDAAGNVYTTGSFFGTADFDPGTGITNLTSAVYDDIFIQKLDTAGNLLWVKQMIGTGAARAMSITTDADGNIYTTGHFGGTVDFDPGTGTFNLTSAGYYGIFIQKLDTAGNLLWAKQMSGASPSYGRSITTDADGNIYTTGCFQGTVDFNPGAGVTNLTSVGFYDIFIQKLSQCILSTGTDVITACVNYTWIDGVTYTASNNTATHILTNAIGCDSIVTLNLTIDTVDISLTITDPSITANASGALYQWLDCNNNYSVIPGATAQSFTATANGNYAVEVTQNSCVDTSACVTISSVGINASAPLSVHNIRVYPNPTTGKIFIEGDGIETVEIINIIWQTVKQKTINGKKTLIDLRQETKGIYFLKITTTNGVVVEKVVLE